jgi:hypothetical protein
MDWTSLCRAITLGSNAPYSAWNRDIDVSFPTTSLKSHILTSLILSLLSSLILRLHKYHFHLMRFYIISFVEPSWAWLLLHFDRTVLLYFLISASFPLWEPLLHLSLILPPECLVYWCSQCLSVQPSHWCLSFCTAASIIVVLVCSDSDIVYEIICPYEYILHQSCWSILMHKC